MDPTYLDTLDADGPGDGSWMAAATMPYPDLTVSPHAAASPQLTESRQQTPLHSSETLSLDHHHHPFYPSPLVADAPYLDQSGLDDFPLGTFAVPSGLFPFRIGGIPDVTSAPTVAGLYSQYTSPTAFLPTPPTADDDDDLSAPESSSSSPQPKKRKRTASKKPQPQQLRTASRAPKKRPNILPQRPSETVEDVKARAAHNQVEQQYRKRLNAHFERLLEVLPAPRSAAALSGRRDGIGERRVSKAEVLDLATERIQTLERDMARLERERRELRARMRGGLLI
ncbi:hypothetical protein AK830_g9527 [Neonectria ditissima]|uniref:BHLH domain-containing protein n=1 Tax=Neonectria ditissima TaxID=78410 RepID=A0A0P7ART7_9HYPO|nr:hypothetical protein AK830_g9527 [Neonectria ditissima]